MRKLNPTVAVCLTPLKHLISLTINGVEKFPNHLMMQEEYRRQLHRHYY